MQDYRIKVSFIQKFMYMYTQQLLGAVGTGVQLSTVNRSWEKFDPTVRARTVVLNSNNVRSGNSKRA